ncbi:zinc ribbon domain-containing protein [Duganella dendranthematis]|uniref:Zinc ribbon domain-containing protein n=1 Tax=Duganella dendranthematis TaxID=2728021 RepID=A0ABX6MBR8_9BURK|nr:zinc ribbon domain-containing protein [Duganella dendranthematis]QJD91784.1 zinc ribbon domain-containing protein [Duganella dendranthematis]
MALQACHECGTKISSEAKTCPQCGVKPKNKTNTTSAIFGGLVAVGVLWFYFGGGLEKQAAKQLGDIHNQVAADSVAQYEIAKASGTPMDRCVQAGLVTAAYLQAKDDANYKIWKQVESADCSTAGVPR